ncbi:MAG TPA: hypothetical protein PKC18_08605, partial [Lacipirellulaceae bacterium]|nr:hypothetical protein [Lacipirellulaceae bacterium]
PSPRATASGGSGTAAGKPTSTIAHGSVPVRAGNLRPRADLLLSGRQPVIESSIAGPPRIIVGRTAEYRIQLKNSGDAAARDLAATVSIPVWADVVDASGSNGVIDRSGAGTGDQGSVIQWQLYELAPGATQTLTLQIVPRSGRPLQLGVQWEHAPVVGEAIVEVEEPRLKMEIDGPGEVMFGKAQRYTLRLSNPGTGDAEEVVIELTPPGGDPQKPVRHTVGALPAGASKAIELELTAREAGELRMLAAVGAAGDLRAETTKTVLCRKAELEIDWRGPEQNFSGAIATYYLRVRNPGTAPADRVAVTATLPVGAEFIDASSGSVWNSDLRQVAWQVGALTAGEERFIQLRCRMTAAGVNHLELAAQTAAGDLSDVVRAEIAVQALADLKLAVADPQGVIPVGETVAYEIKVQNRGQSAARGVNVTAMFSAGIDPTHVEGGQYEINDGRVMFRSIDSLAAGGEVVLRIHAKASAEGTHVFRAEVACEELDIQLAAQETTRFFIEADRWADASAAYSEGEATKR